jgi:hypothetical protein
MIHVSKLNSAPAIGKWYLADAVWSGLNWIPVLGPPKEGRVFVDSRFLAYGDFISLPVSFEHSGQVIPRPFICRRVELPKESEDKYRELTSEDVATCMKKRGDKFHSTMAFWDAVLNYEPPPLKDVTITSSDSLYDEILATDF